MALAGKIFVIVINQTAFCSAHNPCTAKLFYPRWWPIRKCFQFVIFSPNILNGLFALRSIQSFKYSAQDLLDCRMVNILFNSTPSRESSLLSNDFRTWTVRYTWFNLWDVKIFFFKTFNSLVGRTLLKCVNPFCNDGICVRRKIGRRHTCGSL